MKKQPLFSIVIPTYKRTADLRFALFCVLRQNFTDYEIIVCDNSPDDDTERMVRSLKRKKIRYFHNETNLGDKGNYQKGILLARGTYIFLHGDDDYMFRNDTLSHLHKVIRKHAPGYIRMNYLCQTKSRNVLFDFAPNRKFTVNQYMPPNSRHVDLINFILDVDSYFITGIVLRNDFPDTVRVVFTEPCPWIDIILYCSARYGAYFMASQYIIASWSRWNSDVKGDHVLFAVVDGKLRSEKFFAAIRKGMSESEYRCILFRLLMKIYVHMFPAIKYFTGNENLLQVAHRVRHLYAGISGHLAYTLYLMIGFLTPRAILGLVREYLFMNIIRTHSVSLYGREIDELNSEFFSARDNKRGSKGGMFG